MDNAKVVHRIMILSMKQSTSGNQDNESTFSEPQAVTVTCEQGHVVDTDVHFFLGD